MGKVVKSVFGGLLGKTPKVKQPAPVDVKSVEAPVQEIAGEKKTAKAARAALYATEGGVLGEELASSQVGKRPTLLGN